MLEGNVPLHLRSTKYFPEVSGSGNVELMLLHRCSSERNNFISSSSSQQRKLITSKGSSLIGRKQAAPQVEEAMTKVSSKIALSFNGAT
jgi:hypothetical protein